MRPCPNCGAELREGACPVCRAVVGVAEAGPIEPLRVAGGRVHGAGLIAPSVALADVQATFAMPLASTRPQSAGSGTRWWVCAAVRPTLARVVLARGLDEPTAVRLAHAVAHRIGEGA